MNVDLFENLPDYRLRYELLEDGAVVLRAFALDSAAVVLLSEVEKVLAQAPLRHMETPGGKRMSVAMSNCGAELRCRKVPWLDGWPMRVVGSLRAPLERARCQSWKWRINSSGRNWRKCVWSGIS